MERLCPLHQRLQPCPRMLEDIDAPRKPVQKSINWSLRLTKRFHLHERLKSTEKLKRLFSSRLAKRRHGNWLAATCSRLNYSNETTNTVVRLERAQVRASSETPTRLKTKDPKYARWLVFKKIVKRHIRPQDGVYCANTPQVAGSFAERAWTIPGWMPCLDIIGEG